MIGTLAWKEYREQRSVWVALAGLAAVLLWGLVELLEPMGLTPAGSSKMEILGGLAVVLACAYGLVSGALLLAGERETGTWGFLQALAGRRTPLWTTKAAMGAAMTLGQALVIMVLLMILGVFEPVYHWHGPFWLMVVLILPLVTFAWGLLSSALCRNVLVAAAIAIGLFLATELPVVLLVVFTHSAEVGGLGPVALGLIAFQVVLGLEALGASWRVVCQDRPRRKTGRQRSAAWRVLLWLVFRQGWGQIVTLGGASLLTGLVLPWAGLPLWIAVTLLLGVMAGTGVFAGEQLEGASRFLGDQRLSPGRVWLFKTVLWLGLAAAGTGLIFVGGIMSLELFGGLDETSRSIAAPIVARLFGTGPTILFPIALGLSLGLVYGFTVGQILVMVVRKSVVALVLAMVISAAVVGLWLPSLLAGGLAWWQVLVVPVLFLAAGRLAMWPWVSGRLNAGLPILCLAACGLVAAAWMAGCLWYRVAEIPDQGEPFDVGAYVAALPRPEQNEAGRLLERAAKELEEQYTRANEQIRPTTQLPGPAKNPESPEPSTTFNGQLFQVLIRGWAMRTPQLERWLDLMFEGQWVQTLREGVALPPGMLLDPRALTFGGRLDNIGWYTKAGDLLRVRALQLQEGDQDDEALDLLVTALALSRHLRHQAPSSSYYFGLAMEESCLTLLDQWRRRLKRPQAELLRRALEAVTSHEGQIPPLTDVVKADYFMLRNGFDNPTERSEATFRSSFRLGAELTALVYHAPWERARRERILNTVFAILLRSPATGPATLRHQVPGLAKSWVDHFLESGWSYRWAFEWRSLRLLRVFRLNLALALFEIETGKAAQTMNDLVPRYLPEALVDPDTGSALPLPSKEKPPAQGTPGPGE
jgi:hypothetical protein